jgi:chromosome segregation ATPase
MRPWFLLIAALCFGIGVGAAWRPLSGQRLALVEDLGFCEADLAAVKLELSEAGTVTARRTHERDRLIARDAEWRGWLNDARRENATLLGRIATMTADLAAFRTALETSRVELAQAQAKPEPVVQSKPKTKPKLKRARKRMLARTRPRSFHVWFW